MKFGPLNWTSLKAAARTQGNRGEADTSRKIPEAYIKAHFADILGEPFIPKDWGGGNFNPCTSRATVEDRPVNVAFAFNGPGKPGSSLSQAWGRTETRDYVCSTSPLILKLFNTIQRLLAPSGINHSCHTKWVPGPRDYPNSTRTALAALSKGKCYFPGCSTSIITFVDDPVRGIEPTPQTNFDIAHIHDAKRGNRYDPDMTDATRRSFSNLILLCKPHHTLVDKTAPQKYPAHILQHWKQDREQGQSDNVLAFGKREASDEMVELLSQLMTLAAKLGGDGTDSERDAALLNLENADPTDLPGLVRCLGAAVASLPSEDEEVYFDFIRRLQRLAWVRRDLMLVQETLLSHLKTTRMLLDSLGPVFTGFEAETKASRGYRTVNSLLAGGACMLQYWEEYPNLDDKFLAEVRIETRRTIQDRAISCALLWLLIGPESHVVPSGMHLETTWSLPRGQLVAERARQFEIFIPHGGFSFRANVTPRTIDLFGVRENHPIVLSAPLRLELLDSLSWWMVLFPCAFAKLVRNIHVRRSWGMEPRNVERSIMELSSPDQFMVGLS
jgi:hypothetical protein